MDFIKNANMNYPNIYEYKWEEWIEYLHSKNKL